MFNFFLLCVFVFSSSFLFINLIFFNFFFLFLSLFLINRITLQTSMLVIREKIFYILVVIFCLPLLLLSLSLSLLQSDSLIIESILKYEFFFYLKDLFLKNESLKDFFFLITLILNFTLNWIVVI